MDTYALTLSSTTPDGITGRLRYFRFQLSLRDIEEFERDVIVTYKTIRCWCDKLGKVSRID